MNSMKIVAWAAAVVAIAGLAYLISSRPNSLVQAHESPASPIYSLAPGPLGMVSGVPGYDLSPAGPFMQEQAITIVEDYLRQMGEPYLALQELLEFNLAYQAEIVNRRTGESAFGLMIGKSTEWLSPKPGPNLFWSTRYGANLTWVGGGYGVQGRLIEGSPVGDPISTDLARERARRAVAIVDGDLKLGGDRRTFPGYFEFYGISDGGAVGEVDVNAYTGQVWFMRWEAPPVSVREFALSP